MGTAGRWRTRRIVGEVVETSDIEIGKGCCQVKASEVGCYDNEAGDGAHGHDSAAVMNAVKGRMAKGGRGGEASGMTDTAGF